MLSFFPRGVLDEILNLIESVSEGFPSYSCTIFLLFSKKVELQVTQKCKLFDILKGSTLNFGSEEWGIHGASDVGLIHTIFCGAF